MFETAKRWWSIVRGHRKVTLEDLRDAHEIKREVDDFLQTIFPLAPETVDRMTYARAMAYFVEERPKDGRVTKGAMLLQNRKKGVTLVQVFLDEGNDLVCAKDGKPFGRQFLVRELEPELSGAFGDGDLVIVE